MPKPDTPARMRSRGAACAVLAAIVLAVPASASTRSSAGPQREAPVPFAAGEKLTYEVSWSSLVTAGAATIHVAEKKPSYGSTAYYIVAEGRPTPLLSKLYSLYYKADTLLDAYSLLPQRSSLYSEEGSRRRTKTTMFEHRRKRAEYQVQTRTVEKKSVEISPAAKDPLGALFVLRSMPLKAGEQITMPICDNGTSYQVLIQAGENEIVKIRGGDVAAQRLSIAPPPEVGARALSVWFSTDAARVPVKMSAQLPVGAFVLTLSSRQ